MKRKIYVPCKENPVATHLKIELSYNIGGMNYFQGCSMARGLYLSVTPVKRSEIINEGRPTMISESATAFSGTTTCVLEMKRASQKSFDNYVVDKVTLTKLILNVLSKNGNGIEIDKELDTIEI